MATYAEVEDLHARIIEIAAEARARSEALNGDEVAAYIAGFRACIGKGCDCLIDATRWLDKMMEDHKKVDGFPPL